MASQKHLIAACGYSRVWVERPASHAARLYHVDGAGGGDGDFDRDRRPRSRDYVAVLKPYFLFYFFFLFESTYFSWTDHSLVLTYYCFSQ